MCAPSSEQVLAEARRDGLSRRALFAFRSALFLRRPVRSDAVAVIGRRGVLAKTTGDNRLAGKR